jgi:NADH dehydrogenase FAD-containing subunit
MWDDYNVVAIDKNNYFEHIFTNIKTSVDPAFPDRILHSYEKVAKGYPKINWKQGTLKQVNQDDSIDVELTSGKVEKL